MLIHGVADFNLHVLANAMLFAWIAGIRWLLTICEVRKQYEGDWQR